MSDISNFNKIADYLPLLNGAVSSELIILFILYYTPYFNSEYLKNWYETYRLSAVLADVFILMIGFVITRYIYTKLNIKWSIFKFLGILLIVQIIHDFIFYLFFKTIPVNRNKMLDLFKYYANEVSYKAILGDSFMILIAALFAYYFASFNLNNNIIIFIVLLYLLPYFLHSK
jgi:hypothetical protein